MLLSTPLLQDQMVSPPHQHPPQSPMALTPTMVQLMVLSTFSALVIQGKPNYISQSWNVDFGTSSHMTSTSKYLHNV